ncbi:MAG: hypothetical protein HRU41_20565 [Saprospiraceae bacterium]|nr:hypothetical protein [Saprospiraceae bacterium]
MKTKLLFLLFLLSTTPTLAEELNHILKQNFQARGQILHLTIRPEFKGARFVVGVVKANELVAHQAYQVRDIKQNFDLRLMGKFHGQVDFLVTNLPEAAVVNAFLRKPSFMEEFGLFFSPKDFSPGTVNFAEVKLFMGIPWYLWALSVSLLSILFLRFWMKRSWTIALSAGFLVGSIFFDVSQISAQVSIVNNVEKDYPYIQVVAGTQQFLEKVKPHLEEESWAIRGNFPDEYQKLFLRYQLADQVYQPLIESEEKYPNFLITDHSNGLNAQLIEQGPIFQLLKIR